MKGFDIRFKFDDAQYSHSAYRGRCHVYQVIPDSFHAKYWTELLPITLEYSIKSAQRISNTHEARLKDSTGSFAIVIPDPSQ